MDDVLKELTDLGSSGVLRAIEGYTRWYLVSAIGWLAVGIVIVICGPKIGKLKIGEFDTWNDWGRHMASGFIMLIGVAIIIHHLSTICAPEAYAIHHFIKDIKP